MNEQIKAAVAGDPRPWPKAPQLPGPPDPDSLPLGALPVILRAQVKSVAESRQVPHDLPALLALGAVSAAVAGKVTVSVRAGWEEPVGIYFAAILPPATRKSPTFKAMVEPIQVWEAEAVKQAAPRVRLAMDMVEIEEKRLDKAKKDMAEGKALQADVETARLELEKAVTKIPPDGRLLAGDITPESMVHRMQAQGGRMAILEPEGGALNLLAGLYSKGTPRLEEVKKAWSGESLLVDRIGRAPLRVKKPALTFGVCLQPGVLEKVQHGDSFRLEGFMGRILWCRPPHGLGNRLTGPDVPLPDRKAKDAYCGTLKVLLESQAAAQEEDGTPVPHIIGLNSDAQKVLHEYEAEVERDMGDGKKLASIRDWAGKAVGQSVRIAALLEVAMRAGDRRPVFKDPIGGWAMESAIQIVRALSSHALWVLGGIKRNAGDDRLTYVLRRAQGLPDGSSVQGLWTACKGRSDIKTMEDLTPILDTLQELGCLRIVDRKRQGPGRPPSPGIEIHPSLMKTMTKMTTNASLESLSWNSGNSSPSFLGIERETGSLVGAKHHSLEADRAGLEPEQRVEVPGLLEVD